MPRPPVRPAGSALVKYQLLATVAVAVPLVALAPRPPGAIAPALALVVLSSGVLGLRRLQRRREPLEAWTVAGLVMLGLLIAAGMVVNVLPRGLDRFTLTTAVAVVSVGAVTLAALTDGEGLRRGWSPRGTGTRLSARLRSGTRPGRLLAFVLAVAVVGAGVLAVLAVLRSAVHSEEAGLRPSTTQLYLRSAPDEQIVVVNEERQRRNYRLARVVGADVTSDVFSLGPGESRVVPARRPPRGHVTYQLFDADADAGTPVAQLRLAEPTTAAALAGKVRGHAG